MKTLLSLSLLFAAATLAPITGAKPNAWQALTSHRLSSNSSGSITGVLENLSGDTYYAKFSNDSGDAYRVSYKITDGGEIVQSETTMVVRGNSSNSNCPYHCSPRAVIIIIKTTKL